jgi:putative membrane protein insertion efficiency factor
MIPMLRRFLLATLGFYQYWLSPAIHSVFPGSCRFQPTCSQYAAEAIALYGPARGLLLSVRRLARCHPFSSRGGFDPVPLPAAPPPHLTAPPDPLPWKSAP